VHDLVEDNPLQATPNPPSRRVDAEARAAVAVLIPCYNEEVAIGAVVSQFRAALPDAAIFVYDNNSRDGTAARAAAAGAVVRPAPLQGKGNVVRLMFADIEADIYVLVDGDGTYDAAAAPAMVAALSNGRLDMVNGARISEEQAAYRPGHRLGNQMLTGLVRSAFGSGFRDMLSGYRVFSRRFVKSFPAASHGFEIETELTVHALQMRLPACEVETTYFTRPGGSVSKLNTVRDGLRILRMIGLLLREERPLHCFGAVAALSWIAALALGARVALEYFRTGLVLHFPTLIVAVALGTIGLVSLACGLILDSLARGRLEQRRFAYLAASPSAR